jgi:hypothetical protein
MGIGRLCCPSGPREKVVFDRCIERFLFGKSGLDLAKCLKERGDDRAVRLAAPRLLLGGSYEPAEEAAEILALMDSVEAVNALLCAFPKIAWPRARKAAARALSRCSSWGSWNQDYRAAFLWILDLFNDLDNTRYVDRETPDSVYANLLERGINTFPKHLDAPLLLAAGKIPDRTLTSSTWNEERQGYEAGNKRTEIDCSRIRQLANEELLCRKV